MQTPNPYSELYLSHHFQISENTTMQEAQHLSINLSMLYNTLGLAVKDLIKLLSHLYHQQQQPKKNKVDIQIQEKDEYSNIEEMITKKPQTIKTVPAKIEEDDSSQRKGSYSRINFDQYLPREDKNKFSKVRGLIKNYNAPQNNDSIMRVEKTRNRKEREQLNGYSCLMCQKFYEVLKEDFSDKNGRDRLCDGCSRHRSNNPATKYFNDFSQQFGFDD